mmetsp:Transcript_58402/g.96864  ORF Transcript_58402/g.96864 Transcript_58402/m.96864 type:complete len:457 (-) Transcript_58402:256-1626(-)
MTLSPGGSGQVVAPGQCPGSGGCTGQPEAVVPKGDAGGRACTGLRRKAETSGIFTQSTSMLCSRKRKLKQQQNAKLRYTTAPVDRQLPSGNRQLSSGNRQSSSADRENLNSRCQDRPGFVEGNSHTPPESRDLLVHVDAEGPQLLHLLRAVGHQLDALGPQIRENVPHRRVVPTILSPCRGVRRGDLSPSPGPLHAVGRDHVRQGDPPALFVEVDDDAAALVLDEVHGLRQLLRTVGPRRPHRRARRVHPHGDGLRARRVPGHDGDRVRVPRAIEATLVGPHAVATGRCRQQRLGHEIGRPHGPRARVGSGRVREGGGGAGQVGPEFVEGAVRGAPLLHEPRRHDRLGPVLPPPRDEGPGPQRRGSEGSGPAEHGPDGGAGIPLLCVGQCKGRHGRRRRQVMRACFRGVDLLAGARGGQVGDLDCGVAKGGGCHRVTLRLANGRGDQRMTGHAVDG